MSTPCARATPEVTQSACQTLRARMLPCACIALACASIAARAAAQAGSPCGDLDARAGDGLEVTPADRAERVARDAPVVARYPEAAELSALLRDLQGSGNAGDPCSRAAICLFRDTRASGGVAREPVAGSLARVDERTLAFVPDAPLARETDYFPLIARAGFDGAGRSELEFRTGSVEDREPPRFDPAREELRIELDAPPAECGAPPRSLRVRLAVPRASDDGDAESVEILLFLTRAAGSRGPELRARAWNADAGDPVLTFVLDAVEAAAPVCVGLRAVDGVGRASEGETELCFDPLQGSQFASMCSLGGLGVRRTRPAVLVPLTASFWLCLRRLRVRRNAARCPP